MCAYEKHFEIKNKVCREKNSDEGNVLHMVIEKVNRFNTNT